MISIACFLSLVEARGKKTQHNQGHESKRGPMTLVEGKKKRRRNDRR
jgi:hypothetical protein